jgi:hypothetical protein
MNSTEKNSVAEISERIVNITESRAPIVCKKCNETAPFLGMRRYCLNCKAELPSDRLFEQFSLALEYVYIFIDECDEFLGVGRGAILNAIDHYKRKIDSTGRILGKEDLKALKALLRNLGQIGGNECAAAIQIPKEGKFTIAMREENGMASSDAVDLIIKIMLALLFIDQTDL